MMEISIQIYIKIPYDKRRRRHRGGAKKEKYNPHKGKAREKG